MDLQIEADDFIERLYDYIANLPELYRTEVIEFAFGEYEVISTPAKRVFLNFYNAYNANGAKELQPLSPEEGHLIELEAEHPLPNLTHKEALELFLFMANLYADALSIKEASAKYLKIKINDSSTQTGKAWDIVIAIKNIVTSRLAGESNTAHDVARLSETEILTLGEMVASYTHFCNKKLDDWEVFNSLTVYLVNYFGQSGVGK